MKEQSEFDIEMSGTTLNVAVISHDHIILANCGDSRAIILGDKGAILVETRDHKPNL